MYKNTINYNFYDLWNRCFGKHLINIPTDNAKQFINLSAVIDLEFYNKNTEIRQIGGLCFNKDRKIIKIFDKSITEYQTIEMIKNEFLIFLNSVDNIYFWGGSNDMKLLSKFLDIDFNNFNVIYLEKIFQYTETDNKKFETIHKYFLPNENNNGYHNAFVDVTYTFNLIKETNCDNFEHIYFLEKLFHTEIIKKKQYTNFLNSSGEDDFEGETSTTSNLQKLWSNTFFVPGLHKEKHDNVKIGNNTFGRYIGKPNIKKIRKFLENQDYFIYNKITKTKPLKLVNQMVPNDTESYGIPISLIRNNIHDINKNDLRQSGIIIVFSNNNNVKEILIKES